MGNAVSFFAIQGKDGKALQKFYKKVFDWKTHMGYGDMMMVDPVKPDGIAGGISAVQAGPPMTSVYVNVDNIEKQMKKIEKAGGKIAMPRHDLPSGMGSIAGFTDPEGIWVGLWEAPKSVKKAAKKGKAKKKKKK